MGLDLFVRRGYAATRISDIADAAGMSAGLLFHYFESKQSLYEELVRSGLARASAAVSVADTSDPMAYFEGLAATLINQFRTNPSVARMFVLISRAQADAVLDDDLVRRATRDNLRNTATLIEAGQRVGVIRRGDPLALSVAFWGAIEGIAHLVVADEATSWPEAEWIVDILRVRDGV
ncbi:MAG TPA: TetR/AcrR family transcriptional regulator [Propionibacteriaceae bacterium]|nr:TetR/AcrR family transcriptional regulator [Propionibacteriaceae bacterium]